MGLKGVRVFVSDKCLGLVESLGEFYPEVWQRCTVHFYRKVWTAVPTSKGKEVAAMLKAIHAQEDRAAARQKAELVAAKLKEMKLADAAALVLAGIDETLYYYVFPSEHWRCLRTNNPLERLLREVRRRTRAVGTKWGTRRYMDMNRLAEASEAARTPTQNISAPPRGSPASQPPGPRLNKCAKNSGHYLRTFPTPTKDGNLNVAKPGAEIRTF